MGYNNKGDLITEENYVGKAESVITALIGRKELLTTSKIRKLLAILSEIYTDARHDGKKELSDEIKSRIQYFKMRFVYEAGREETVKAFWEAAQIEKQIDKIGNSKKELILFCHYMEALVAYRKFLGGKDA
ncbi:MAG: type III-A CRISPR-associated protein Csm2 [Lachnospiraceae bacterium]|jgi:CRISPR-associated protein, csm2 family|nr:type III-A CRISPR-associated protein Csm2 [Lachnospiraceae bacterium]